MLRVGVRPGWHVRLYRRCLAAAGYESALIPEGDEPEFSTFSLALDEITRNYQEDCGLVVDGIAGPVTLATLAGEVPPKPRVVPDKPDGLGYQLRQSIVHVARYACDVLRIREVGGPNSGPMVEALLDHAGAPDHSQWPWCAAAQHAFIDYGYLLLGLFMPDVPVAPGVPELSCSMIHRWAEQNKRLRPTAEARPGDVYLFAGGGSGWYHVGLVEQVGEDGELTTIEGNTSADPRNISEDADGDGVYRRLRPVSRYPGAVVSVT